MMGKLGDIVNWVIVGCLIVVAFLILRYFFSPRIGTAQLSNLTPYKVIATIHYRDHDDDYCDRVKTVELESGDQFDFRIAFHGIKPNFKVYYESTQQTVELIRWHLNLPHDSSGIRSTENSRRFGQSHNVVVKQMPRPIEILDAPNSEFLDFDDQDDFLADKKNVHDQSFLELDLSSNWWNPRRSKTSFAIDDHDFPEIHFSMAKDGVVTDVVLKRVEEYKDSLISEFEKPGEIVIANALPFDILVQCNYPVTKDSTVSDGWLGIQAGEKKTISLLYQGVEPEFNLAAKTASRDTNLLRWCYDRGASYVGWDWPNTGTTKSVIFGENYNPVSFINDSILHYVLSNMQEQLFYEMELENEDGVYKTEMIFYDETLFDYYEHPKTLDINKDLDEFLVYAKGAQDRIISSCIQKGSFLVQNLTPFDVFVCINKETTAFHSHTLGWFKLEAGESQTYNDSYYGIDPNIGVYAKVSWSDATLMREAFDLHSGENPIRTYEPWIDENSLERSITDTAFDYTNPTRHEWDQIPNAFNVRFASFFGAVQKDTTYSRLGVNLMATHHSIRYSEGIYAITDPKFKTIVEGIPGDLSPLEQMEMASRKANALRSSLQRRVRHNALSYDYNYSMPFHLGALISNHSGENNLGVRITQCLKSKNILGDPYPLAEGDIIQSINGISVFCKKDVETILHDHGNSIYGGITEPLLFEVYRDGFIVSGSMLYFFEEDYPHWVSFGWFIDKSVSAILGGANSSLWGLDENLVGLISGGDPHFVWKYIQYRARMSQFNPTAYTIGSWGGSLTSLARKALIKFTRKKVRSKISKKMSGLAMSTLVEGAEGALWSLGTRSPVLTEEEFMRNVADNVLFGMGMGILVGTFNGIRR